MFGRKKYEHDWIQADEATALDRTYTAESEKDRGHRRTFTMTHQQPEECLYCGERRFVYHWKETTDKEVLFLLHAEPKTFIAPHKHESWGACKGRRDA